MAGGGGGGGQAEVRLQGGSDPKTTGFRLSGVGYWLPKNFPEGETGSPQPGLGFRAPQPKPLSLKPRAPSMALNAGIRKYVPCIYPACTLEGPPKAYGPVLGA